MARTRRIDLPGIPQHIVQRGVNRTSCFCDDLDRAFYLNALLAASRVFHCQVHAYVLMSNHVHLLATANNSGGISAMMQSLGRRYVRRFNWRHARTGTLWEGRFKSSLIDSDTYLLACYNYIELNPVRAGICITPQDYRWSSVHANAFSRWDPLVHPHPLFQKLGTDENTRILAYQSLLENNMDQGLIDNIRTHLNQGKVLGSEAFQRRIESQTGKSAFLKPLGRPRSVGGRRNGSVN